MGVPILYPWANRLSASQYGINGAVVTLTPGTGGVRADEHGVPIHGVLTGYPGWLISDRSDNSLTAVLDYGGRPRLLASFPFPHVLTQRVTLADRTLTVETTVTPTTAASVPLCFGYHPYVQLPGIPRADWTLTTPAMRHRPTDDWGLPTGAHDDWESTSQLMGSTTYDDGFDQVPEGSVFTVSAGDRRVEVAFVEGYPAAQLFAPPNDDVIAIEPMAAPTDALRSGNYRFAVAGKPETTTFSITAI